MDLRVFVLCLVALCGNPEVRGDYFDELSTYERSDSNESEPGGTFSTLESTEYPFGNEYDEPFDVKSSSNIIKTSFKSRIETDRTEFDGSKDPVSEKSARLHEDFDDVSESIACPRSSLPFKPPKSIASKDQTVKAIKDENSKKSQDLRSGVECTSPSKEPGKPISTHPTPIIDHYADSPKDVEMILPPEKTLFLPLVNGKPKPYDGYRAPPKDGLHLLAKNTRTEESPAERERRLSLGEIIYGEPRVALRPKNLKKRSTLDEYDSSIQPEYESNEDFFNSFEVKPDSEANKDENDHTFYSEGSYEVSSEGNENSEETKHTPTFAFGNFYKTVGSQIQVYEEDEKKSEEKKISEKSNFHPKANNKAVEDGKTYERYIQTLPKLLNEPEKSPVNEAKSFGKTTQLETKKANLSQNVRDDHVELPKSNQNVKTNNKRAKRSAIDATYLDSHHPGTGRYGKDKYRAFGGPRFTDSRENPRNDYYKRPSAFNFQQSNKKFSKGGHGGFGGHNSYNIRNRPKTLTNWSEPTKKANSVNYDGESSKVHEGSFTFENSKSTYGVPASIYSGMFQSSEEYDEPFERVEVNESPKERNYARRTYSSGRYFNQYNKKHSERKEFHSHAVNRGSKPVEISHRTSFPESRVRPKKNTPEYRLNLDDFLKGRGMAFAQNHGGIKEESRRPTEYKQPSENRVKVVEQVRNGQLRENKGDSNCWKEKRGEMTCIVCTYKKNSTTHEQCQYSTKESNNEKYFAYERQKSTQTNGKPDEHSVPEGGSILSKSPGETLKENESSGSSIKSSIASKTESSDLSQRPSGDHRENGGVVIVDHDHDPKRFLRKTQQHGQSVKYEASTYPYEVGEEPAEDESTGEDGLTFASFGGDDFGAAFLEFGKHATEDMFHPKISSDEDFDSNDKFDFDSMSFSFEDMKSSEEA